MLAERYICCGSTDVLNGINIQHSLTSADVAHQSLEQGWKLLLKLSLLFGQFVSHRAAFRSAVDDVGATAWPSSGGSAFFQQILVCRWHGTWKH